MNFRWFFIVATLEVLTEILCIEIGTRPALYKIARTVIVNYNENTKVGCRIKKGDPLPTFKWQYKKSAIGSIWRDWEEKQFPASDVPTKHSFITSSETKITVSYRCTATNIFGSDNFRFTLIRYGSGTYGEWSEWGACSKSCGGGGIQKRSRICLSSSSVKKRRCKGESEQKQMCNLVACKVNGAFGSWTEWSNCTKACGGGKRYRERECNNPPPSRGGDDCKGTKMETKKCGIEICKVDGVFGNWTEWSNCAKTCGGGTRYRTRKCNNPSPSGGGEDCKGLKTETKDCNTKKCKVSVNGAFGNWTEWSNCTKTCGEGTRYRTRECNNPSPSGGGESCRGLKTETEECNTKICKVDGAFGNWTEWSNCTKICGGGTRYRTRECNSPPPLGGGKDCKGLKTEKEDCNTKICKVNGAFGKWTEWSNCTKICGGGIHYRTRVCNNPSPSGGGEECKGLKTETEDCNTKICKVNGVFGNWTEWSDCTKTCGGGTIYRTRECNSPPPSGGGEDCKGSTKEIEKCNTKLCRGPSDVSKAQEEVESFIQNFQKTIYPDRKPTGQFYKAVFEIQKAVAAEVVSVDPTVREKSLKERLVDLENIIEVASKGRSIDFARKALGKGLFTFIKLHREEKRGLKYRVKREADDIKDGAKIYLDQIRAKIGDKAMDKILSSTGDSTLMFVIDTTGSMSEEIDAAKEIAKQIISATRESEVSYILSTFNDPGTGPVIHRESSESKDFVSDIDALTATGGGDCPELAVKGMLNAINEDPEFGSPMFVFTDASAKDADDASLTALKSAADVMNTRIYFFTHEEGCDGNIKAYKEIKDATDGEVFPLKNEAELVNFAKFVDSSLHHSTVITAGGTTGGPVKRSTSSTRGFVVDEGISKIIISVIVKEENTAKFVTLTNPNGEDFDPYAVMSKSALFEVEGPKTGTWYLEFPNSVGRYEYNVQGVSANAIEFTYNFMYQHSARKNSPTMAMMHPFKGEKNMLVVRMAGIGRVNMTTIKFDIVDTQGKILHANFPTFSLASASIRNATIIPPNKRFKIKLTGKTIEGNDFERISRGVLSSTTAYLHPILAGYDFTVRIGKGPFAVQFLCINKGPRESIKFTGKAQYGRISNPNQSRKIRKMSFLTFRYIPPKYPTREGKTDRIVVTAVRPDGQMFTQHISVLLLM